MNIVLLLLCFFSFVFCQAPTPSPATKLGSQAAALFVNAVHSQGQACAPQCPFLRQAHVKQHGCLTGILDVVPGLPASLQKGLFDVATQGKSRFEVIARYSNGKGNGFTPGYAVAPDSGLDVRGFALKVFGVSGTKGHQRNAETVDFISITSETLFMDDMSNAMPFFQASEKNSTLSYFAFLGFHPILSTRLVSFANSGAVNQLQKTTFYTVAPLSMGLKPAKFRFQPCAANPDVSPLDTTSPDLLRNNLRTYFSKQRLSACYNVSVQVFQNNQDTPIEDLTKAWKAPWLNIASLTFFPQDVWSSSVKDTMCRQIAFHPKQTLRDNQPYGWVQRVRDLVYSGEQQARHSLMRQPNADWTTKNLHYYQNH